MISKKCWAGQMVLAAFVVTMLCTNMAVAEVSATDLDVGEIKIFGVKLDGAKRADLRKALKAAGMTAPSKTIKLPGLTQDIYKVSGQFDGAKELTATFADDSGVLVSLFYRFTSEMALDDVAAILADKYGAPGESKGSIRLFPRQLFWPNRHARWVMSACQDEPGAEVVLSYANDESFKRAVRKALADDQGEKVERAKTQSNAF